MWSSNKKLLSQSKVSLSEFFQTKIYAFFLLLMISGWIHLLGHSSDEFKHLTLSHLSLGVQVFVYFLAFVGIYFNRPKVIDVMIFSRLFSALVLLSLLSVLWTTNFIYTATHLVGVLGVIAIALNLALQFSVKVFLLWLIWLYLFFVVVNYGFIYFFPEISMSWNSKYSSPWKGVFHQKNLLAQAMIIFLIISYIQLLTKNMTWLMFIIIVIVTAPLVYYSQSMTVNVLLLAGFCTSTFIWLYFKYRFSLNWFIFSMLLAIVLVVVFKSSLLSLVGKSETLTGRTITWGFVYEQVKLMPFLGHGYGIWRRCRRR